MNAGLGITKHGNNMNKHYSRIFLKNQINISTL